MSAKLLLSCKIWFQLLLYELEVAAGAVKEQDAFTDRKQSCHSSSTNDGRHPSSTSTNVCTSPIACSAI